LPGGVTEVTACKKRASLRGRRAGRHCVRRGAEALCARGGVEGLPALRDRERRGGPDGRRARPEPLAPGSLRRRRGGDVGQHGAHGVPERPRVGGARVVPLRPADACVGGGVEGLPEEGVVAVASEAAVEVESAPDARVALGQQRPDLGEAELAVDGGEVAEALAEAEHRVGARADGGGAEAVRADVGVELVHGRHEVVGQRGARHGRARRARLPRHGRARVRGRRGAEREEDGEREEAEAGLWRRHGVGVARNGNGGCAVAGACGVRWCRTRRSGREGRVLLFG